MAKAAEAVEATIAGEGKLDAHKLRADFPSFEQRFHGKPLAYLDSATPRRSRGRYSTRMREFYETSYANVHRGVYVLGERATAGYEGAREKVRALINAASTREVVFTRNGTEGAQPRRLRLGPRQPRARATSSSRPSSSTTRTSCPGSTSRSEPARSSPPSRSTTRASCSLDGAGRDRAARPRQARRLRAHLQLARDGQPGRGDRRAGHTSRTRSSSSTLASRRRTARSTCRR